VGYVVGLQLVVVGSTAKHGPTSVSAKSGLTCVQDENADKDQINKTIKTD
jgi:hypothetical protein